MSKVTEIKPRAFNGLYQIGQHVDGAILHSVFAFGRMACDGSVVHGFGNEKLVLAYFEAANNLNTILAQVFNAPKLHRVDLIVMERKLGEEYVFTFFLTEPTSGAGRAFTVHVSVFFAPDKHGVMEERERIYRDCKRTELPVITSVERLREQHISEGVDFTASAEIFNEVIGNVFNNARRFGFPLFGYVTRDEQTDNHPIMLAGYHYYDTSFKKLEKSSVEGFMHDGRWCTSLVEVTVEADLAFIDTNINAGDLK